MLLGDAAWSPTPLTGLGTSLAIVGAYVLACELSSADLPTALRRYEEVLRPYVTTAQKPPPGGLNAFAPRRATAIRLRHATMRMMTHRPFRQLIAAQFDKAKDITLPNYVGLATSTTPLSTSLAAARTDAARKSQPAPDETTALDRRSGQVAPPGCVLG